jgi:hypothetical protein
MSHLSVQKRNLTVFSNLHYYGQKQVQLLSLLSMNKLIVFLLFLNKGSTVIFLYLFSSALLKKKLRGRSPQANLYRPSDRRLSAKLVPTFTGRGCCVVSATNPHGR